MNIISIKDCFILATLLTILIALIIITLFTVLRLFEHIEETYLRWRLRRDQKKITTYLEKLKEKRIKEERQNGNMQNSINKNKC